MYEEKNYRCETEGEVNDPLNFNFTYMTGGEDYPCGEREFFSRDYPAFFIAFAGTTEVLFNDVTI
jgi:hypothetical protein